VAGPGQGSYPTASRLLITADAGGSNGDRTRAWKTELAMLAAETGLAITVCHLPPGTSKWNKVEHRLFAHISMNWRGRPLTSHDVIINSMAATTTRTGLSVHAELDPGSYPTGVKIGDAQVDALPMSRHRFHGDWNYTLHPRGADQQRPTTAPVPPPARQAAPQPPGPATLHDPQLTGMSRRRLDTLTSELTVPLAQQREHNRHQRRGSQRRRAAGAGAKDSLAPADRILATILYLRKLGTQEFLAELFGVARSTLTRAVQEVQPLLAERGHTIPPSTARFRTPADVTAFLTPEPAHPTSKPTR
jgi:hypothetical protein